MTWDVFEQIAARIDAEKRAQAEAEAAKIKAEADAEVLIIQAEAEAEANRKISASLTSQIIEMKRAENEALMYEKWNGVTSQISGTGDITPVVKLTE